MTESDRSGRNTRLLLLVLLVTTSLLVPTAHGRETVVKPGDTLWSIAKYSRASESTTVARQAIAILNLNPTAFTGGNMNRMRHGVMLKLPTEQQVEAIDSRQASKMAGWRKGAKPDALDSQTVTVIRGLSIAATVPEIVYVADAAAIKKTAERTDLRKQLDACLAEQDQDEREIRAKIKALQQRLFLLETR